MGSKMSFSSKTAKIVLTNTTPHQPIVPPMPLKTTHFATGQKLVVLRIRDLKTNHCATPTQVPVTVRIAGSDIPHVKYSTTHIIPQLATPLIAVARNQNAKTHHLGNTLHIIPYVSCF